MSNALNFATNKNGESVILPEIDGFTRTVPEEATLTMLCMDHKVKCFEIEVNGNVMVLAHFEKDGWTNIYQDGEGALSNHLFFLITAYQGDTTPEEVILDLFTDSLLRD